MLTALDELLDADLDEDSLQVEDIVAFCVVRHVYISRCLGMDMGERTQEQTSS